MDSMPPTTAPRASGHDLVDRTRDAAHLLELIAADRAVLADLPADDRHRLLRAIALVRNPSSRTRRRLEKAAARAERAARVDRDQQVLDKTGIRTLRRRPVVTTSNYFLPVFSERGFEPNDVHGEPEHRESIEPQACY